MKQSNNIQPCLFDGKCFMLPEFWELFDNHYDHIPYCIANNSFEALFYIHTMQGDRPMKANIFKHDSNILKVTALKDNGTIWNEELRELKELFMQDNDYQDNDIYVTCQPIQEHDGRYIALQFNYYHTSPDQ